MKLCFSDLKRLNIDVLRELLLNESISFASELDDGGEGG